MTESLQRPIGELLWQPDEKAIENCNISLFFNKIESYSKANSDYSSFHQWSVENAPDFWAEVWQQFCVIGTRPDGPVLENPDAMPGARWFPGSTLNFAENLLRYRDDHTAIIFRTESGR